MEETRGGNGNVTHVISLDEGKEPVMSVKSEDFITEGESEVIYSKAETSEPRSYR